MSYHGAQIGLHAILFTRTKSSMKKPSRTVVVTSSLFVFLGPLAHSMHPAQANDRQINFQEALDQCVDRKANELSGWDRITASMYYKTEWQRQCRAEAPAVLNLHLDKDYSENTTADLNFREQLSELDKVMTPTMGQGLAEKLELKSTVIRAGSATTGRSTGVSEAPIINTVTGYSTQRGKDN
jgi:hypothetical protein